VARVFPSNARGRAVAPARLRRVFRLRQLTRQVRQQGQIRLHNFGLYVADGLFGQTVSVTEPRASGLPEARP
jgi:hypothetical protein